MNHGFSVPYSSSPPSTPGSQRNGHNADIFAELAAHSSSTPAGPPPSSAKSFTPVGLPPPPAIAGGSKLGSEVPLFTSKPYNVTNLSSKRPTTGPLFKNYGNGRSGNFSRGRQLTGFKKVPSRLGAYRASTYESESPSDGEDDDNDEEVDGQAGEEDEDDSDYEDEGEEDEEDDDEEFGDRQDNESDEDEGVMEIVPNEDNQSGRPGDDANQQSEAAKRPAPYDWTAFGLSGRGQTARSPKRSRQELSASYASSRRSELEPVKKRESAVPTIVRDLANRFGPANLVEPDELIIETETLIEQLWQDDQNSHDQEQRFQAALAVVPEALCKLWQSCCHEKDVPIDQEYTTSIGPSDDAPDLHKAAFVSTMLLKLHHPPSTKGKQAFAASRSLRKSLLSSSQMLDRPSRPESYPKLLISWLDEHHNPYRTALSELAMHRPNPTAHTNFWDILYSATLRGKLAEVVRLLRAADFQYARTARDEGQDQDGYHGLQLSITARVVNHAVSTLESCPALQDDDWDVTGTDWMIFRRRVEQAMSDLASTAEGSDGDMDSGRPQFEARSFGIRSTPAILSVSVRRAKSKVPWTVYQNLKTLYSLILGGTAELVAFSQDWVEATVGLAVWWDGGDNDENPGGSLAASRRSLRRSQPSMPRTVDEDAGAAYRRRLAYAFDRVTNGPGEDNLQINSNNSVEVGLASVFEGNVEGVLGLLNSWSLPIAAASMEVGSLAGWFESAAGELAMDGFDSSDLIVLSYARPERALNKDGVLNRYAELLFEKEILRSSSSGATKEGWELALGILARLDDLSLSNRRMEELLDRLTVDSDELADKLIATCCVYDLEKKARDIAEKYADYLAESSDQYGTALVYYARSHNVKKVKDVLDLLISLSLVHSIAFPAAKALDGHLSELLSCPRDTLRAFAEHDLQAAEILSVHLSGYATLRKFYDLRDEEITGQSLERSNLRPIARKRAAVAALLAVIASATESIQGGLWDDETVSVVPVDGLLVLLGETMPFIDQPKRLLSLQQLLTVLRAIEDLQSVHPRIMASCNECLKSSVASAGGSRRAPSPRDLLKKSISSLTASSGFSLVGSSMLEDGSAGSRGRAGSSGDDDDDDDDDDDGDWQKRGWDWRAGLQDGMDGNDLLRILRLGLARDVARAWMEEI